MIPAANETSFSGSSGLSYYTCQDNDQSLSNPTNQVYNQQQNQCFHDQDQILSYSKDDDIMHGCDEVRHEDNDQIEDFFEDMNMAENQGIVQPEILQLSNEKQNEGTYLESSRTVSETITINEGSSNMLQLPSHDNSMSTS